MTKPCVLIAFSLFAAVFVSCGPQERWREIALSDGKAWLDRRSVVRNGDSLAVWFRFQLTTDSGGYSLGQVDFNCARREYREGAWSRYDSTGAKRNSSDDQGFLPSVVWRSVPPQSNGEAMLEAACNP